MVKKFIATHYLNKLFSQENQLKVSGEEFEELTKKTPNWAEVNATKECPVIVTSPVFLKDHPIESLSPYIVFSKTDDRKGGNRFGYAAAFQQCSNLRVVTGRVHGNVSFHDCGITEIDAEHFVIYKTHTNQAKAYFTSNTHLKVARGTFPCGVDFIGSGIETIDTDPETGLVITDCDSRGYAAYFENCLNLKVAQGRFPGAVVFYESGVEQINTHPEHGLIITGVNKDGMAASFRDCKKLTIAQGSFPGRVTFDNSGIKGIQDLVFSPVATRLPGLLLEIDHCENLTEVPDWVLESSKTKIDPEGKERILEHRKAKIKAKSFIQSMVTPEI